MPFIYMQGETENLCPFEELHAYECMHKIFKPICSLLGMDWNACFDFTAMAWKRNSGKKYSRTSKKKQRGTMKLVIIIA